ncbi:MAG: MFS transporter [Arachnia sp.]
MYRVSSRHTIRVAGSDREFHRVRVLAVLILPLFMSMLSVSAINVALPAIESGLGASESSVQWLLSGYTLAFGVLQIPAGRFGDALGRGSLFVVGVALFTVASLAGGLALSPVALNVFRLVQGIGAGLYVPQVIGMIQQYFTGNGRARAFAIMGIAISASVAVGPVMSGSMIALLGDERGWRASFLINAPIGLAVVALALIWLPFELERQRHSTPRSAARLDLDPIGMILIVTAVLAIMWPFMQPASAWVWALLPAGLALVGAWVAWERGYQRRGGAPMVDMGLYRHRSFALGTATSGVVFLGVTSTFVVVAIVLQQGLGVPAFYAGLIGLPNAAASAVAAGWSADHVLRHGRRLMIGAIGAIIVGSLLCAVVFALAFAGSVSFWWLLLTLIPNGVGMGIIGSANQTLTLLDVPPQQAGAAGGVKSTGERVATSIGIAMITSILFAATGDGNWTAGAVTANLTIAAILTLALVLALIDARLHTSSRE